MKQNGRRATLKNSFSLAKAKKANSLAHHLLTALLIMADGVNIRYFPCNKLVKMFLCHTLFVNKIQVFEMNFSFPEKLSSQKRLLKRLTMITGTKMLLFTSTALQTSWRRNATPYAFITCVGKGTILL